MNIAIVHSEFYPEISARMLDIARKKAGSLGITVSRVAGVPGVFDIPLVADALLARPDIDGAVVLGAVIKGATKHDEVITHAVAASVLGISLRRSKPVALGISGPAMQERQAYARIRPVAEHAVGAVLASHIALQEAARP